MTKLEKIQEIVRMNDIEIFFKSADGNLWQGIEISYNDPEDDTAFGVELDFEKETVRWFDLGNWEDKEIENNIQMQFQNLIEENTLNKELSKIQIIYSDGFNCEKVKKMRKIISLNDLTITHTLYGRWQGYNIYCGNVFGVELFEYKEIIHWYDLGSVEEYGIPEEGEFQDWECERNPDQICTFDQEIAKIHNFK